ncbi:uncharacterized protein SPSK_04418 [Sporothrix schenckii 1099-18]|uniref:Cyclase n=2 Tax=Sporothrix schenckii TaxID=29908 RepID=U7PXU3_SPOS1|nr:uncharacterized protein SPSK_04418 [Sporothrix schenckii 1099-18]ERS99300.1 hypothetical protein HMPREF1624_04499 [Sporothrix schenckii ATCC 58251]KJR82996.1 hypothetical protein SPSK_04418 [Sporothrix schenckii 1099-18]
MASSTLVDTPVPERPPFDSLPLDPNGPPGNAWGLYGDNDRLGALNMLTPAVVAAAARQEIQTGERVSLDWSLNKPSHPSFGRPPFEWKRIVKKDAHGRDRTVNDDYLAFNTQGSSQWDGFRHYGYQQVKRFYGNVAMDELEGRPDVIGIDAWVDKGGIVGRGVLLDYAGYCKAHSIDAPPYESTAFTVEDLDKVIAWQKGPELQSGDILFIRSGSTEAYEAMTTQEQQAIPKRPATNFIGLAATKTSLRWLWEHNFAAVAGDAPSFEQAPLAGPHVVPGHTELSTEDEEKMKGGGLIHQWVLAGWGVPIGEMFDLEALARKCAERQRWSFFVSSVPLKVPGGVASPPNAIAIF